MKNITFKSKFEMFISEIIKKIIVFRLNNMRYSEYFIIKEKF